MGSASAQPGQILKSANNQLDQFRQDRTRMDAGQPVTLAQKAFEQGVKDANLAQGAVASSGFGGNTGQRLRGLDNARADLSVVSDVARQKLLQDELDRIRGLEGNYSDLAAGVQASNAQYNSALLNAGATTGASLLDTFGSKMKK